MDAPFESFGHRIDFEVRGAESTPTVLLLHGIAGDRALLASACDDLLARRGLRRIHLDLPGHGRSLGALENASADHLVGALTALVASLCGTTPPLVIGHSYGAYLALGLARDLRLDGLFLACPVIEPDLGRRRRPPRFAAARTEQLLFADDHEQATFEEVAVLQSASLLHAYHRLVVPASRACDRAFVDALRGRYVMSRPWFDAIADLARPVAIVCGRHDHWVGFEDAAALLRAFPDASIRVVARAGQLLPLEAPDELRAALDEWLDRALAPAPFAAAPPAGSASPVGGAR